MAVEFRTLAVESGWNNAALRTAFWNALPDVIKDELVVRDEPEDLNRLIELASRLDGRLRERQRRGGLRTSDTATPRSPIPDSGHTRPSPPMHYPLPGPCYSVMSRLSLKLSESEPMELGQGSSLCRGAGLSVPERCLPLLWPGWSLPSRVSHSSGKCSGLSVREIWMSQLSCPSRSHPQLSATLCWNTQSLPITALVDSGADESFLDREVARQLGLELLLLDTPLLVRALNGML